MFGDGMIRNPLEWILVAVFALFLCGVVGTAIGGLISFGDWYLDKEGRERRRKFNGWIRGGK